MAHGSRGPGLLVNNILIDSWPRALLVPPLLAAAAAAVLALVTPWLARIYARLARWVLSPSARTRLVERVEELTETAPARSTPTPPSCAASSGTCTTAPRRGWSRSPCAWAWPRRA